MAAFADGDPNDNIRFHDGKIWTIRWRFESGEGTIYSVDDGPDGTVILTGYREGAPDPEIIPCYSTDLAAALAIWPEEDRPEQWTGSAWSCCIAALQARKKRLRSK